MPTPPACGGSREIVTVRWGTAKPVRFSSAANPQEMDVRGFGTARLVLPPDVGELPAERCQQVREAIVATLAPALAELDRPADSLPSVLAEASALVLPTARARLAALGLELIDLAIEGLAVPGGASIEPRALTPEPVAPQGWPGSSGMPGMTFAGGASTARPATASAAVASAGDLVVPQAAGPRPGLDASLSEPLRPYWEWLARRAQDVPWAAIDSYAAEFFHPQQLCARALHVALSTDGNRPLTDAELRTLLDRCPAWSPSGLSLPLRPLPALEAIGHYDRLLLFGGTGGGKTFTAMHVVGHLARAALGQAVLSDLPGWAGGLQVPVYLALRRIRRNGLLAGPATAETFWKMVEEDLAEAGRSDSLPALRACHGQGILWVLDGLDELQNLALEWTLSGVAELAARPRDGLLVLSRDDPVTPPGGGLSGLTRVSLSLLDGRREDGLYPRYAEGSQIEAFVRVWYEEAARAGLMPAETANETGTRLLAALQNPALRSMAANPLLLAKMVLFQATRDPLPQNSAVFCREVASLLLLRWAEGRPGYEVGSYHPVSPQHLEGALEWCAHVIRQQGSEVDGRLVLEKAALVRALAPLMFDQPNIAAATLDLLVRRGGLLAEGPPGMVGFVYPALLAYLPV